MIKRLIVTKQVAVAVVNDVGALARITSFLVNHGINVEAVAGYARNIGDEAELMFVTNDNIAAIGELACHGYNVIREDDVIIVELENSPGALKNISERLAQSGINITYIYGTACPSGCPAKLVLATSDNNRAVQALST
ncbi:MAG: hypothetical protein HY810_00730 [Candidatus Omnitrophica bacterium]|nr:hypothetical protein [Candidatus Omnitrophota bacterium]